MSDAEGIDRRDLSDEEPWVRYVGEDGSRVGTPGYNVDYSRGRQKQLDRLVAHLALRDNKVPEAAEPQS